MLMKQNIYNDIRKDPVIWQTDLREVTELLGTSFNILVEMTQIKFSCYSCHFSVSVLNLRNKICGG